MLSVRLCTALAALCLLLAAGCGPLADTPEPSSTGQRLEVFRQLPAPPLTASATVYWDDHQIPYITAQTDRDAAFVLGMVQAHLRLGQMEVFKRVAQGRLSEMLGPLTYDIDVPLRAMDLKGTAEACLKLVDDETRQWLEAFARGVNFYKAHGPKPYEFTALGLADEPWRPEDSLAIGRLGGADVTWLAYFSLLPLRDAPDWPELWKEFKAMTGTVNPGADGPLAGVSRSGSNSLVVAPSQSADGHALIASDPHLGFTFPNIWLAAGVRCPGMTMVGMMPAGIPAFGFGRTPHVAWGGTNLRAWSSDLVDVTGLPPAQITERTVHIGIRAWPDDSETLRQTPYGPIITDAEVLPAPQGKDLALRWMGHRPSDDIGPFLRAARAQNVLELRRAFAGFTAPGQNILAADTQGNIIHFLATTLPCRSISKPDELWRTPAQADRDWAELADVSGLPYVLNPAEGVLSSANNQPPGNGNPPVGWLFSPNQRADRLKQLALEKAPLNLAKLSEIQRDTYSRASVRLRDAALAAAQANGLEQDFADTAALLKNWDGMYQIDSRAALVFQGLFVTLAQALDREHAKVNGGETRLKLWDRAGFHQLHLAKKLPKLEPGLQAAVLREALQAADTLRQNGQTWGDVHRLQAQHLLGNLPVLGRRFKLANLPMPGGRETVLKSHHSLTVEKHAARFGSQSRHISDMGDPDANFVVLLGGQDGWLNSANFADQMDLFLQGDYVQLPLTLDRVRETFRHVVTFAPQSQEP